MRIHFVCLFWTCKILGHRHYWILVALYSLVVPWKIIRYIPLSDHCKESLQASLKCCSMANVILIVHVTQVIIVVKIKTIHIYHAYKINIPWGLVQMFVCHFWDLNFVIDQNNNFYLPRMEKTKHPEHHWLLTQHNLRACFVGGSFSSQPSL